MAKELVFLRHGQAGYSADGSDRILTELGKRQAKASALKLKELGFMPKIIITSPLTRAMETAAIAKQILECANNSPRKEQDNNAQTGIKTEIENALAEQNYDDVLTVLNAMLKTHDSILAVGHVPLLEEMPADICGQAIRMKTGSFAWLKVKGILPGERQGNELKENFMPGEPAF